MKPLLESAVLTRDDTKIWLNINLPMRRKAPKPLPSIAYFEADRRDAALMYQAQHNRWAPLPWAPGWSELMPPWLETITFGCGPVGGDIARYITTCA